MALADYKAETGDAAEKVLELARKRRDHCLEYEAENRTEGEDDIRFAKGEQWPERLKRLREDDDEPCLTVNKIGQYIRQVVNDSRQNSPSIRVYPVGGGADQEVAKVFNGIIRDIEQATDSEVCYDTAIESTARCGEGYWRLLSRYMDDSSFDQELYFSRIRNPYSVHIDPAAQDPAGMDMRYGFVDSWVPVDELREEHGDDAVAGLDTIGMGQHKAQWVRDDSVMVAEYYTVEENMPLTLVMLRGGGLAYLEEMAEPPREEDIVGTRKVKRQRVVWRKITATKVLEKTVWPCKYIPIFRVIGEEFEVDGKVFYNGLVRPMKDSVRMYNYWISSATAKGALEQKAPYIGPAGFARGREHMWKNANKVPYAYLEYEPVTVDDHLVPPPARNVATFAGRADVEMAQLATDDMKQVAGMYNAGLGAASNETSGKAIIARQRESDTGTFHYVDNLSRAIKQCGRVLVEIIPKFYSKQRVVRLLHEDGSDETVTLNERIRQRDKNTGMEVERVLNDITVGRYDVRVSVGPSYATRRIEAADSMIQFTQAVPQAGAAIMDILAKNMDWPGADEIATRLRKLVPPELIDEDGDEDARIAALMQQVQALTEQVAQSEQALAALDQDRDFQREIETIKRETELLKAEAARQAAQENVRAKQEGQDGLAEIVNNAAAELAAANIATIQSIETSIQAAVGMVVEAMKAAKPEREDDEGGGVDEVEITGPSGSVYKGRIKRH